MSALISMAVRTAAGGLEATFAALTHPPDLFAPPHYPTAGLVNPDAASVPNLERDRPAEVLLLDVIREVLGSRSTARIGLVVATTSGNISEVFERSHRAELAGHPVKEARPGRDGPTRFVQHALPFGGPVTTLSVACISGTAAFLIAEGWLADGRCDEVVVAGVDALSQYVHAGFSGLGALSTSRPRPFSNTHDGMLLGEGAAAVLVGRQGPLHISGIGVASDARHATAPDREGRGALRAALDALMRSGAGPDDVHTISPHGTGTVFSDAMEALVIRTLFPEPRPLQLVKPVIGHTLGATGVIEAAMALRTLQRKPGAVLSMSSAFGGMNASIVLSSFPGLTNPTREVFAEAPVEHTASLRDTWRDAPPTVFRHDRYYQVGLAALLAENERSPLPERTALVLSSRTNCAIVDRIHHARIVNEGPARASRRAFADTLPASPLCAASIQLGIRGPLFAFIDDPERAPEEAARLVRHGYADEAVAIALEIPTPDRPPRATTWRFRS